MSVKTVEYLGKLFHETRATPNEREARRAAFREQIRGPVFDPNAISISGKRIMSRLQERAAANRAAS